MDESVNSLCMTTRKRILVFDVGWSRMWMLYSYIDVSGVSVVSE